MTFQQSNPHFDPLPESGGSDALSSPNRFFNRDHSWLEFNARVLEMCADPTVPLLERVRFMTIYSRNLDEFYMKRIGALRHAVETGISGTSYEPLTPAQVLHMLRTRVIELDGTQSRIMREQLVPALRDAGIALLDWKDLTESERADSQAWFRRNVFPILTPLAVDPGHRFPFISNMSVSLGLVVRRPGEPETMFARVKVPESPTRLHELRSGRRFIPIQEIIEHNLEELFPGMEILQVLPFRVTRDAEIEAERDASDDLLESVEQKLKERKFARVVRLEVARGASPRILRFLMEELDLGAEDIYETMGETDYGILDTIADIDIPALRYPRWTPLQPIELSGEGNTSIFSQIRKGDIFLHHPYQSFDLSVEQFIKVASEDPKVLCIKQSLYRTSGDSPFIASLIRAAESGKQVAVLVELRARFDEARNIEWARKLENAGVHVAYGVIGLKTHTKTALVVRQESDGIRCYGHVGTGNYNSKTARLYEDVGILTSDPLITEDLIGLFNYMTGRSRQHQFNKLLIAPVSMKRRFLDLIDREVQVQRGGGRGRIIAKMNQIEDRGVMDALYRASEAGVQIDLIVRGFCCVRPGVPGLSQNIRVRSILGRFLEHSRIFYFGAGKEEPLDGEFFIGSADWMYRNLQTRVEAATPIDRPEHRRILWATLEYALADVRQSWELQSDGSYTRVSDAGVAADDPRQLGLHQRLMNDALALLARHRGEPSELGGGTTSGMGTQISASSQQAPQSRSKSSSRKPKNRRQVG
ncbi:MAG: polyphosphate kinase 1 [Phycisphaerales bacterium]|nr:polyphosphate kinase 1 [Phycisphaerales bacterium]